MKDLSFLRDLNVEQRNELLRLLQEKKQENTQREARVATSETTATTQERGSGGHVEVESGSRTDSTTTKSLTSLDELSEQEQKQDTIPFDHNLLSHDRQCLRATLEEWARQASECLERAFCLLPSEIEELTERERLFADLNKWWDATSYTIHNDWLFTDEAFLTIRLVNANSEAKELRLHVVPC